MKCPECRHENVPHTRFCVRCGNDFASRGHVGQARPTTLDSRPPREQPHLQPHSPVQGSVRSTLGMAPDGALAAAAQPRGRRRGETVLESDGMVPAPAADRATLDGGAVATAAARPAPRRLHTQLQEDLPQVGWLVTRVRRLDDQVSPIRIGRNGLGQLMGNLHLEGAGWLVADRGQLALHLPQHGVEVSVQGVLASRSEPTPLSHGDVLRAGDADALVCLMPVAWWRDRAGRPQSLP